MARGTCSVCHAEYAGDVRFCPRDGAAIVQQPSDDVLIGTTIDGRYFIRRLIGRGGMGVVYEADHVGLDKRVAIKFILEVDRELVARFRREARAAARIEHDNVVQIFDVGAADGRDFIVMEYLDGRDLRSVLEAGALPAARALAITRQILHGLHAIHEAGIVHRDIKPANILLVGDDALVKIMDFGISAMLGADGETLTRRGQVIGTPQFMAPEQLAGGPVDRRADIYAVALTLHAMLTGKMPYTATSVAAIATQQLDGPPELDVTALGIPVHVADALRNALSRAPADRFSTALELAAALEGPLPRDLMARTAAAKRARPPAKQSPPADAPTVAERPGSGPRSRASGRRWIVVGAAAIALAAIAVVTFIAMRPRTPMASHAPSDAAAVAIDPLAAARAAERDGKLDIAIARYLEAFDAKQDPELLFRVGELYERLDRTPDAIHYFERYLERSPGAKDRDAIVARIARLRPAPLVDAGVADAAPQIATNKSAPKPDPRCRCIYKTGDDTWWLCPKKQSPRCHCAKGSDGLCPTPYERCPDTGDCPKEATTLNDTHWTCSIGVPRAEWKKDVVPDAACQGYSTDGIPRGNKPYEPNLLDGKWSCSFCLGPVDAPVDVQKNRFAVAGKPGDACSGHVPSTGARATGHVECKDKW